MNNPTDNDAARQPAPDDRAANVSAADVKSQPWYHELRNELRSEALDRRGTNLNHWFAVIAIVITLAGLLAGYIAYDRFDDMEKEINDRFGTLATAIEGRVEEAEHLVEETKGHRDEAKKLVQDISAQTVKDAPEEAEQAVANIRKNPKASLLDKAVASAVSLQQQGKDNEAIEKWRAIAHVAEGIDNDQAARAWHSIGLLLYDNKHPEKNLEEVISAYDKAIRLKPDYTDAYMARSFAKSAGGRQEAAIADMDEAIRLEPDRRVAYSLRGIEKLMHGRHEAAIADIDEAIRLQPNNAKLYEQRGIVKFVQGRFEAAIADYDRAIRLDPGHLQAYTNRGQAKAMLGQYEAAITDYDEVIRLKPDGFYAYSLRGDAKSALRHHDDALADYDEAIRLAPNLSSSYIDRGLVKFAQGRFEAAIADYNEALRLLAAYDEEIRLKSGYAKAHYDRGVAKNALGHKVEAREDFNAALELARKENNTEIMAKAEKWLRNIELDRGP